MVLGFLLSFLVGKTKSFDLTDDRLEPCLQHQEVSVAVQAGPSSSLASFSLKAVAALDFIFILPHFNQK